MKMRNPRIKSKTPVIRKAFLYFDKKRFKPSHHKTGKLHLARKFGPVFPFYVTLMGIAFAGAGDARKPAVRRMPFLLCGLLALSVLNLRLAPAWRKKDYRSAAQFARRALAENKSVWWVADGRCATYYHLDIISNTPLRITNPAKCFVLEQATPAAFHHRV